MFSAKASSLVHLVCNKIGPIHYLRAHPVISLFYTFVSTLLAILVVYTTALRFGKMVVPWCYVLPLESMSDPQLVICGLGPICLVGPCCFMLGSRVPHEQKVIRLSFLTLAAVLLPEYVLALTRVLVKAPPIVATILLGAKLE